MTLTSVGITASRHGLSTAQRRALTTFLHRARLAGAREFHHGCCVGGDEIGAQIAHNLGYRVVGHPPSVTTLMSNPACRISAELRAPRTYLTRDKHIVDECGALIGLPNRPEVWSGSGTWFTVHYAQLAKRPRLVILPNGHVVDRVGVDELHTATCGEYAAGPAITESSISAEGAG